MQYAAAAGVGGLDSFTYTLQDVHGQPSTATVAVVVTVLTETDGAPQVAILDPAVQSTTHFTSSQATVTVDAPAGVYTGVLAPTQIFFLSYTPIVTPTAHTLTPPGGFYFGGFEFELAAFLDDQPLRGLVFAQPLVLTIRYDPALLSSETVDARIAERGLGGLQLYNGATHQALLAQPNFVRDLLARPAQPIHRGGSLPEAMDPEDLPKIAVLPV